MNKIYLHELKEKGTKSRKRIGRGDTTATRGTKGQKSRKGATKINFGEDRFYLKMPILRGFRNNKVVDKVSTIRIDDLNKIDPSVPITSQLLTQTGLAKRHTKIKIVNSGKYDGKDRNFSQFNGKMTASVAKILLNESDAPQHRPKITKTTPSEGDVPQHRPKKTEKPKTSKK